jgi:MinD-like ATPase involved in chromosome partitioning or flagellar assembly
MSVANPVICFYSFKGGAGRTVCTANFASAFAKQIRASDETPVLLADMDLDSAGMTMMMKCAEHVGSYTSAGLVSGTVNLNIRGQRERFFSIGLHDISKVMRAGVRSVRLLATDVAPRESALVDDYAQNYLRDLIGHCEDMGFRGVIIDSASGSQDSARVCQLAADVVICCCRMTDQFYYGTRKHLETFVATHGKDINFPSILILPVAVPTPSERFRKVFDGSVSRLEQMVFNLYQNDVNIQLFDPGIGEVEIFKWQESVLSESEEQTDAVQAAGRFKDLAAKVMEIVNSDASRRAGA